MKKPNPECSLCKGRGEISCPVLLTPTSCPECSFQEPNLFGLLARSYPGAWEKDQEEAG